MVILSKTYILLYRMIKYNKNDRIRKKHECQKDNVNFQSFYVDVSIEELTLTLSISFVKGLSILK